MNKILVTPRSLTVAGSHPELEPLAASGYELVFSGAGVRPDERELVHLVPGCVGYLAGMEKISARVLEAATDLRVLSRNGTVLDNVDLQTAARLGIKVLTADGANTRGVAELTIALMLAVARAIPLSAITMARGEWERVKGFELEGRTLGVVGCGRIGRLVAQIAAVGFGMRVLGYDPYPPQIPIQVPTFELVPFDKLLRESDVVSLHCPPLDNGSALITTRNIHLMRHGVVLINTARGSLVDFDAVLEALEGERIFGFATDVYPEEPPESHVLFKHPRVITTPHIGGYTDESVARASRVAVANLIDSLQNVP